MDKLFTKDVKGLMLGLDGAGKTTILYNLKLNEVKHTIPTIGFNVETVTYRNLNLTIWDIGGQEKIRKLWRHYYNNIDMLIYVVDSNDMGRLDETKNELHSLINEDQLRDMKAILIYCNKMDLPNSISCVDLAEKLELNKIKNKKWYIQPSCAAKNQGLYEGLQWLSDNIS
tara:strand:+ start:726 stop:1238 length:513 start_codon:yes stop_codon:yes gene_type:complete